MNKKLNEEKQRPIQSAESRQKKPLEEMDVIDNFLFTEIAFDEETGG